MSKIEILDIKIGQMQGDIKWNEFSVIARLKALEDIVGRWQLGFYMPRPFVTVLSRGVNDKLTMKIVGKLEESNLEYVKNEVLQMDFSQGTLTLLEPSEPFKLLVNHEYEVELRNNNQGGVPTNVSGLPQSFFISVEEHGGMKAFPLMTKLSTYTMLNHDHERIEKEISAHIRNNWDKSQKVQESCYGLIPTPKKFTLNEEKLRNISKFSIEDENGECTLLSNFFGSKLENTPPFGKFVGQNDVSDYKIILKVSPDMTQNNEGYNLNITESELHISASHIAGIYHGFQTLFQLLKLNGYLPLITLADEPRFSYRGILLDVARHFYSLDEIKKFIEIMASHKLNTLHLHLSDDEGFRVKIEKYPKIHEKASVRGGTSEMSGCYLVQANLNTVVQDTNQVDVNTEYCCYYTQREIRELVEFANFHNITVIPEIDLPGHARALIKAYPEYFYDKNESSDYVSAQGYTDDVLPIYLYGESSEKSKDFTRIIDEIVQEIARLFEGQTTAYAIKNEVSVAGDEVSFYSLSSEIATITGWEKMNALEKTHSFFRKMSENNPNLILSGWQQFVQMDDDKLSIDRVSANRAGHAWVWNPSDGGISQAASLINKGYNTVLAYADQVYFDLTYTTAFEEFGQTWAGRMVDTHQVLSMVKAVKTTQEQIGKTKRIAGIEGALFSENIPDFNCLMYQSLPRMAALSEASWSSEGVTLQEDKVNWKSLAIRLGDGKKGYLHYLESVYGVNYRGIPNGISKEIPKGSF